VDNWLNEDMNNPDGSLGSYSSCHTWQRFSLVEARKPEARDQCHLPLRLTGIC
jgi:hydroxylamine dehydrogenase